MEIVKTDRRGTAARSLTAVCTAVFLATAVGLLSVVAYCIARRVAYPFELEWMEGCFIDHARRLVAGQPLYRAPDAEFVPLLYTPLSYHAAAWLMKWGVGGFVAGRLVSLAGVVGAMLLGCRLARRAAPVWWMWVAVPALVAAGYVNAGSYYDVIRPDNLMTLFATLMLTGLAARGTWMAVLLMAVGGVGAVLTKQSSVVFVAVVLAAALVDRWRVAVGSGLLIAGACAVIFILLDDETRSWFAVYAWELPRHHRLSLRDLARFVLRGLCGAFLPVTLALVAAAATAVRRREPVEPVRTEAYRAGRTLFVGAAAAMVYSAVSCLNAGTAANVHVLLAVVGGCFVPVAVARGIEWIGNGRLAQCGGLLVLAGVMLAGVPNTVANIPKQKDRDAWETYRLALQQYGPSERVWTPYHGAAIQMRPHLTALRDYLGGYYGRTTGREAPADLVRMVSQKQFSAIVIGSRAAHIERMIGPYYKPDTSAPPLRVPEFSGWPTDEERVWIPR